MLVEIYSKYAFERTTFSQNQPSKFSPLNRSHGKALDRTDYKISDDLIWVAML